MGTDKTKRVAHGADCLAAQLVAHLKKEPGGIYLYPIDDKNCGEAYEYTIQIDEKTETIQMEVENVTKRKIFFRGTPAELLEKLGVNREKQMNDSAEENETGKNWTEQKHLSKQDRRHLREIRRLYEEGRFMEAMEYASARDTIVREAIPIDKWKKMGGKLTHSGEQQLKEMQKQHEAKRKDKRRGIER